MLKVNYDKGKSDMSRQKQTENKISISNNRIF